MKILKEFLTYAAIIILVLLIRTFLVTPIMVSGSSMEVTLSNGDMLILKKYDRNFERNEVVVINHNKNKLIKRVIGLPKEHIAYKDNKLYVDGKITEIVNTKYDTVDFTLEDFGYETIPDGYYFVLGDNRINSSDSRTLGLIKEEDIIGSTNLRIYPFNKIGIFK